MNEVLNSILERERLQHTTTLERERLQHTNLLEQQFLQNAIALERERVQHAAAVEKYIEDNRVLRLANSKLENELLALKRTLLVASNRESASSTVLRPRATTTPGPIIGSFYTSEVRPWNQPRADTSKQISFISPYSAPPGLPIGLNMLDIGNDAFIRIHSHSSNVKNDRFSININTWADTKLYGGGCTWLEIEKNNTDFQFGAFNTLEDFNWDDPQSHHTRLITFPRSYSAPPRVVVWLTVLEMRHTSDWRVKTYETNVTATGFTIHIETLGDSVLNFGTATWVAYPADKPGVLSGRFSTMDIRPPVHPQLYNSGHVSFGKDHDMFTAPPRVLMAINSFEISCKHFLRLKVNASTINASGMTWHIDSWDDTILYSAGASYIAVS